MTLPRGFSWDSTYKKIMGKNKMELKQLQDSNQCVGCLSPLDQSHTLLCHGCTHDMTEEQLDKVIRRFKKLGIYPLRFPKIDTDLRGTPAGLVTAFFLSLGLSGILFAVTSIRFGWPVESDGAIGLGSIFGSIGFGIGFAFLKARRALFKSKGDKR